MYEYRGNVHIHTLYSDGTKWHAEVADAAIAAGLDFIIVTDHNVWVDEVEGYYRNEQGSVLLLVGEEVHDPRLNPQRNHFLAYGADCELAPHAVSPQKLIDRTNEVGGYGFLAHPYDRAASLVGESEISWQDWDVENYAGLEIWNYMSNFKSHLTSLPKILWSVFQPERFIERPLPETLSKWDALLAEGRVVAAVGSSDAHGMTYRLGPLARVVFPYEYLFRAVNTHLVVEQPLTGELEKDKPIILDALGKGRGWIGYDLAQSTSGFRYSAQSKTKGIMGDILEMGSGATLQVLAPESCDIRLIHQGRVVAEAKDDKGLTFLATESGAYRVECEIMYRGKDRGWIYSNPVYLR